MYIMRMKKKGLQLNRSYDDFLLGSPITMWENLPHSVEKYTEPEEWYCYYFNAINKKEIEVWCENGIIDAICCRISCIFKGNELIKMNFQVFLDLIEEKPSSHDIVYVVVTKDRGQNQHVYEFDKSGLQIWVWRNKICTVIIRNSKDDEE